MYKVTFTLPDGGKRAVVMNWKILPKPEDFDFAHNIKAKWGLPWDAEFVAYQIEKLTPEEEAQTDNSWHLGMYDFEGNLLKLR